jgi:CBS domain containing-hemolysin-like protein
MLLLTIYVSIAIGVSFICSVLEAVLLSISPSYIAQLKQNGHPAAESLDKLKTDIDRPLASILTLNTIAHTIGAATAGAQAAVVFGSQWLGVFSAVLTLGILVLSEIVPKTIGDLLASTCPSIIKCASLDGLFPNTICVVLRANYQTFSSRPPGTKNA